MDTHYVTGIATRAAAWFDRIELDFDGPTVSSVQDAGGPMIFDCESFKRGTEVRELPFSEVAHYFDDLATV